MKGHYALCFKTRASFGAHHENLNEDRPTHTISDEECRPMTLVSDNIRFMRIFPASQGFPGEKAWNDSGVVENVDFQSFRRPHLWNLRK